MAHIDVRGPWPVYINGFKTVELRGEPRSITVEQAERLIGTP